MVNFELVSLQKSLFLTTIVILMQISCFRLVTWVTLIKLLTTSASPIKPNNGSVSIVFVGSTGTGKSTTINFLTKSEIASIGSEESVTNAIREYEVEVGGGMTLRITDTPGLGDTNGLAYDAAFLATLDFQLQSQGLPDVVILCARFSDNRYYGQSSRFVKTLRALLLLRTQGFFRHFPVPNYVLLLTHVGAAEKPIRENPDARVAGFRQAIANFTSLTEGMKIVLGENMAAEEEMEVVPGGFKLPNGDIYPRNLKEALLDVLSHNEIKAKVLDNGLFNASRVRLTQITPVDRNSSRVDDYLQRLMNFNLQVEDTEVSQHLESTFKVINASTPLKRTSLFYLQHILNAHGITRKMEIPTEDGEKAKLIRRMEADQDIYTLLQNAFEFEVPTLTPRPRVGETLLQDGVTLAKDSIFDLVRFQFSSIGYKIPSTVTCKFGRPPTGDPTMSHQLISTSENKTLIVTFELISCNHVPNTPLEPGASSDVNRTMELKTGKERMIGWKKFLDTYGSFVVTSSSLGGRLEVSSVNLPTQWRSLTTLELVRILTSGHAQMRNPNRWKLELFGGNEFLGRANSAAAFFNRGNLQSLNPFEEWLNSLHHIPKSLSIGTVPIENFVPELAQLIASYPNKARFEAEMKRNWELEEAVESVKKLSETIGQCTTNLNSNATELRKVRNEKLEKEFELEKGLETLKKFSVSVEECRSNLRSNVTELMKTQIEKRLKQVELDELKERKKFVDGEVTISEEARKEANQKLSKCQSELHQANTINRRQKAWATLYSNTGHNGRTYNLDFRNCDNTAECCKNMYQLDDDTQSINTHGTCVHMFQNRNCEGYSVMYFPGSPNHNNFGDRNDVFSSGKPCF